MDERFRHLFLYAGILVLYLIPLVMVTGQETTWTLYTILRIAGLWGFISLALGAILNLSKKRIKVQFGKPFLKIHHYFAFTGLILITLHPLLYAFLAKDPGVFIPDTSSLYEFFAFGGRVAILLFYAAFLAGICRMAIADRWRYIHVLVYPAIIIAAVHANLMGQTLSNPIVRILIISLTGVVCVTFLYTRFRRIEKKKNKILLP